MPYVMQSKGQQQSSLCFALGFQREKLGVLQSRAYVEPEHKSRGCFIFLVSFTDQSRTDSEPPPWEPFQFENVFLNLYNPIVLASPKNRLQRFI
jgi:hypothetical protein